MKIGAGPVLAVLLEHRWFSGPVQNQDGFIQLAALLRAPASGPASPASRDAAALAAARHANKWHIIIPVDRFPALGRAPGRRFSPARPCSGPPGFSPASRDAAAARFCPTRRRRRVCPALARHAAAVAAAYSGR